MFSAPDSTARSVVSALYGHRLRVRVCGLLRVQEQVLLVRHRGVGPAGGLWAPPGGGLEFGESLVEGLQRECREETGLEVAVGRLMGVFEHLAPPLHAIELLFETYLTGGHLRVGSDPEMGTGEQLITDVRFMSAAQITALPASERHRVFDRLQSWDAFFAHTHLFTNQ